MSKFHWSIIVYVISVLGISLIWYTPNWEFWFCLLILITVLYSMLLFAMSMMIQQNFYLKAIHQSNNQKVVLTFDDGPHPEHTPRILKTLGQNNIKAVFFMIGKNVAKYPEIAKEVIKQGHQVGVHTQNHSWNFGFLLGNSLKNELLYCQQEIEKATGIKSTLFRPPFGVTNPNIAALVKELSLQTIGWNARSFDTATKLPDEVAKRVLSKVNSNSIILLHDRLEQTSNALPEIIRKVNGMGFAFGILENIKE